MCLARNDRVGSSGSAPSPLLPYRFDGSGLPPAVRPIWLGAFFSNPCLSLFQHLALDRWPRTRGHVSRQRLRPPDQAAQTQRLSCSQSDCCGGERCRVRRCAESIRGASLYCSRHLFAVVGRYHLLSSVSYHLSSVVLFSIIG